MLTRGFSCSLSVSVIRSYVLSGVFSSSCWHVLLNTNSTLSDKYTLGRTPGRSNTHDFSVWKDSSRRVTECDGRRGDWNSAVSSLSSRRRHPPARRDHRRRRW